MSRRGRSWRFGRAFYLSKLLRKSRTFIMNLGKKTINVGKGIMNLAENFIESLLESYWGTPDDFHETAGDPL